MHEADFLGTETVRVNAFSVLSAQGDSALWPKFLGKRNEKNCKKAPHGAMDRYALRFTRLIL